MSTQVIRMFTISAVFGTAVLAQASFLPHVPSSPYVDGHASSQSVLPQTTPQPVRKADSPKDRRVFFVGLGTGSVFGVQLNDDITYTVSGSESEDYHLRFDFRPGHMLEGQLGVQSARWELSAGLGFLSLDPDQLSVYDHDNALVGFRSDDHRGDEGVGALEGHYVMARLNYLMKPQDGRFYPVIGVGLGNWHYESDTNNERYLGEVGDADDDLAFVQGNLGLRYEVSEQFSWQASYQYAHFSPVQITIEDTVSSQASRIDIDESFAVQGVSLSAFYQF